ncbi:MAG: hypothetical protein IPK03_07650 [Bacteroidetes bacterium]|nr:hypothetical protein [Bacteroidota bacterium]
MTTTQFNQVKNTVAIKGGTSAIEAEFNALITSMSLDQFLASFGGREDLMGLYVDYITRTNRTDFTDEASPIF